jgi:hypothetical protein
LTIELVSQLDKIYDKRTGQTYLQRIVENLMLHAAGQDYRDDDGNVIRDKGDLKAILAIFDRLEGRPAQRITGPSNGPIQPELRTVDDVRMFLLGRGLDAERIPPPMIEIIEDKGKKRGH